MSCFKRLSPSDADVVAVFQQELARAGAIPSPAGAAPPLWPRFAGYYQGLARLPRRARRALQRRWRRSLGGLALLCALGQAPVLAATITVDGTSCTLIDAVTAANNDAPAGGCTAGSGADTLVLPAGSTHTLTAVNNYSYSYGSTGLPRVTSAITIAGNGSTITRDPGAPQFRILEVAENGHLTLQEITVSGGANTSLYGRGGGLQNSGILTLTNSTVSGNSASSGGGVHNNGTLTLTNSTVSGNSAANRGGGVSNITGILTLVQTVVSGNTASGQGPKVDNYPGGSYAAATVIANNLNLFGHDGVAGVVGFVQGRPTSCRAHPWARSSTPRSATTVASRERMP